VNIQCGGNGWPDMTLVDFFIDSHGEWSACCTAPAVGDTLPFGTGTDLHPTTYTANSPDAGHGTSGWFIYQLSNPVEFEFWDGVVAGPYYYFSVSWSVPDVGSNSITCGYRTTEYGADNNGDACGLTVPEPYSDDNCPPNGGADYCLFLDTDGPIPDGAALTAGPRAAPTSTSTATPRPTETPTRPEGTPLPTPTPTPTPRPTETPRPEGTPPR
jgi:hypothetical protein